MKRLGLIGALVANIATASPIMPTPNTVRTRAEFSDAQANTKKYTLGVGQNGNESFRLYNNVGEAGDFTSAGLNTSYGAVFATEGDKSGIGIEAPIKYNNTTLTLTGERASHAEDKTRFGASLDQTVGPMRLGASFDTVKDDVADTTRDYALGRVVFDGKDVQAGTAFRRTLQTEDNSAMVHFMNYGQNGTRTFVKADWSDANPNTKVAFDVIYGQDSTFSKWSGYWLEETISGGMYDVRVTPNPISAERCALQDRTKSGFVAELSGAIVHNESGDSQSVKAEAGYVVAPNTTIKAGATASYTINPDDRDKDRVGGTVYLSKQTPIGKFTLEGIASQAVSATVSPVGAQKTEIYGSATYSKSF
jgi:hypothetical protein